MIAASGYGRRGCDLSHLIGAADAYNHDIPTEEMIERSVGRLIASQLMAASDNLRVRLTAEGRSLAKQAKGGLFERAPTLLRLLRSRPLIEGRWELPTGAWRDAYEQYVQR
jgi:hypothetical protein